MTDVKLKALADVFSGGKGHKAGSTFTASEESAEQALAFGLVERVEDEKKTTTRKTAKR